MVAKQQQIASFIPRGAGVSFDQSLAQLLPLLSLVGGKHRNRRATLGGPLNELYAALLIQFGGQHAQLTRVGELVDRKGLVVEVGIEVLQLTGVAIGYP
ncbi:MAG: hypothetical protein IIW59_00230, partial [Alistipes sp.]|nr:hypothetical protein [Alistipes sp.]